MPAPDRELRFPDEEAVRVRLDGVRARPVRQLEGARCRVGAHGRVRLGHADLGVERRTPRVGDRPGDGARRLVGADDAAAVGDDESSVGERGGGEKVVGERVLPEELAGVRVERPDAVILLRAADDHAVRGELAVADGGADRVHPARARPSRGRRRRPSCSRSSRR